jgi:riboflavin biosynthesis RibT protein
MFDKIAMGLLSFMPNQKDLQKLQMTMNQYKTEQEHQLYLWKEEEGIIGLVGVLFVDQRLIQVKHISVSPSHRGIGVGKKMVRALKEIHPDFRFIPDENTVAFFNKCDENQYLPTNLSEALV